jgi:Domain of unknown function (DUF6881)/HYD1 signature containing ADP-ribosyltransferase
MPVLFHYTDAAGLDAILLTAQLLPSTGTRSPNDVRYGDGQYLTDIEPGTMTGAQLSRRLLGHPWMCEQESFARELIDMQYLRVQWTHRHSADPVEIWMELDESGWEVRKLEIFPDGTVGYANGTESANSTTLGETPIPPVADIAADPQFKPTVVTKNEFEGKWTKRFASLPNAQFAPPAD